MTWSAVFEDHDGDGWLDLFATGGHIPAASFLKNGTDNSNLLLAGNPTGFILDPPAWDIPEPLVNSARGVTLGDFDSDEHLELAVAHVNGDLSVYDPLTSLPAMLRVRPTPTHTGPSGAGFRVECTCGGISRMRELAAGGHLGSSSPSEIRLTFPGECGQPGTPLQLVVRWPSGYVQLVETTMGALLPLVEPQWILIDDTSITITPTDTTGALLTDTSALSISADNAEVAAPTGTNGTFIANYTPTNEGPVRFTISIGGKPLNVHPTRLWTGSQPRTLRTHPQQPVVGLPYTIQAIPRTPSGQPVLSATEVEIAIDGVAFPASLAANGTYEYTATAPTTSSTVEIQLRLDGADYGLPISRTISPRIDPTQSRLRMGPLYVNSLQALSGLLNVYLVANDVNGFALDTNTIEYELTIDGVTVEPSSANYAGEQVLLTYNGAPLSDGSEIRFFADGVEFPGHALQNKQDGQTRLRH